MTPHEARNLRASVRKVRKLIKEYGDSLRSERDAALAEVERLKRDVAWFTMKHDEAVAKVDEYRANVTGLGSTLSVAKQEVKALQQRVTQYDVEAVALRTRIAELKQDRDQWRKRVEMEDLEVMGIIGVNDRG